VPSIEPVQSVVDRENTIGHYRPNIANRATERNSRKTKLCVYWEGRRLG